MNSASSGQGLVPGCCEHGDRILGLRKEQKFPN
jgi:hypothetical protein